MSLLGEIYFPILAAHFMIVILIFCSIAFFLWLPGSSLMLQHPGSMYTLVIKHGNQTWQSNMAMECDGYSPGFVYMAVGLPRQMIV